jgi:GNAT superfamily N-acetyltransferase
MSFHPAAVHEKAFNASVSVVFVYEDDKLIAFGRAIGDGVIQAALYDIAVLPAFQGRGIGKVIVNQIIESLPGCNFILYASPGKEPFYQKLKFRKMKTGMALFVKAEAMTVRGFTE